ncbi:ATP-binding cassette domain-containing protein [Sporolactobacillus terrae]|uniref:Daunorubicin resistance protein DrrA family ABC transporter ATP-binding protein n=1 Tax=Sporolactobacillus terrae TaxID=269673 RepID=A0A5K7WTA1_9BACL|nr:daunorubicin resistance protein DrrA family ABC transporter ATP-binding protein [Sporolactobacillus terrae]
MHLTRYAIDVHGLSKSFNGTRVLKQIDFSVSSGSIFALLGPNGAGKTTIIHILSTLLNADAGSVFIDGHDVSASKEEVKQLISLTGQYAAVDELLTAQENLIMMGRLFGLKAVAAKQRALTLLQQFDLVDAAHKTVRTFSGGMRRRLDLAVSIIVKKPILFLDEPTTGLDTVSRRSLWAMIRALKAQGTTIFLTTQYLEEADQLADHIAFISNGRIVAKGTADELKAQINQDIIELRNEHNEMLQEIPTDGTIQQLKQRIDELIDHVPAQTRIRIRRPSMDDVFLSVTDRRKEEINHEQ